MYVVPLFIIVLIAIGILFSPIASIVLLFLGLIVIGALKFAGRTEPETAPPPKAGSPPANAPGARTTPSGRGKEERGGLWGEVWPEERSGAEKPRAEKPRAEKPS
jgi:hypothetical protein